MLASYCNNVLVVPEIQDSLLEIAEVFTVRFKTVACGLQSSQETCNMVQWRDKSLVELCPAGFELVTGLRSADVLKGFT